MNQTWLLFLLCLVMGLAAWSVFWWCVRSGQFLDAEAAAAEMLESDALESTVHVRRQVTGQVTRQVARSPDDEGARR